MRIPIVLAGSLLLSVSAQLAAVESSGKQDMSLRDLPPAVSDLVQARSPGFSPQEAEVETRNGQIYYDVEGIRADGQEIEFDITQIDGSWTIVEVQRDIGLRETPDTVRASLEQAYPEFAPRRIIESDQGDGVVIYEFFGPGIDGPDTKIEVRYEGGQAEVLAEEWVH